MRTRTKVVLSLVVLLFLGGLSWFLYTGRTEATFERITPEQASRAAAVLAKDSDNDGLKDWEEELWKTDILAPDTDADGTNDGEEIQGGRDPLKAGPGDTLDQETVKTKTVPGGGEWTETDRLSRELFAKYLSLKQSGEPLSAKQEEELLTEFIERYPKERPTKTYTLKDLTLTAEDTEEAWRTYGNAIGSILKRQAAKNEESEMIIFERALQNEDETDLRQLETRIEHYEKLGGDFKAVPVPRAIQHMALALINAVEAVKESVSGMALIFTDPVQALAATSGYPPAVDRLTEAFGNMGNFFKENGITFEKSEAGYILTQ